MRLSEMLTAIREYPALKIQYEAMREQQASQERTAVQLSIAYNNLQIGNRQLSQKNKALETALVKPASSTLRSDEADGASASGTGA